MNRRDLLALLGASGVALSFLMWRTRTEHDRDMDELPLLPDGIQQFAPPPLQISRVGWKGFLEEWDRRVGELILQRAIAGGLGRHPAGNNYFVQLLHKAEVFDVDAAFVPWTQPSESSSSAQALKSARLQMLKRAAYELSKVRVRPFVDCDFLLSETMSQPRTEVQAIAQTEERLHSRLPKSYKEFLSISNGWKMKDTPLLSVDKIGLFREKSPEAFQGWANGLPEEPLSDKEYFIYGPHQPTYSIRSEYFKDLILISGKGEDNIMDILLNPRVVTEDGEWEAWKLSSHYAGAVRCRSFGKLMEWLYQCEIASFGFLLSESKKSHATLLK